MDTLGFEPGDNPLLLPVTVPTLSPLPIQVPNSIKVKKFYL